MCSVDVEVGKHYVRKTQHSSARNRTTEFAYSTLLVIYLSIKRILAQDLLYARPSVKNSGDVTNVKSLSSGVLFQR